MKRSPTEVVLVVECLGRMALVLTMDELQIIEDEKRFGHQAICLPPPATKPPPAQHTKC